MPVTKKLNRCLRPWRCALNGALKGTLKGTLRGVKEHLKQNLKPKGTRLDTNVTLHAPYRKHIKSTLKNEVFAQLDRFGALLPYGHEVEDGIFTLENATGDIEALGFVLEIAPQTGATPELARHLEGIFSADLPKGCGLQVTLFASPDIAAITDAYRHSRTPACVASDNEKATAETLMTLAIERARYLTRASREGISGGSNFRTRHFRAWLSVTYPVAQPKIAGFAPEKSMADLALIAQKVKNLRKRHTALLKTFHLYAGTWDREVLLQTVSQLTHPHILRHPEAMQERAGEALVASSPREVPDEAPDEAPEHFGMKPFLPTSRANPLDPLRDQVMRPDTHIQITESGLRFSALSRSALTPVTGIGLSVRGYPTEYALWIVQKWTGGQQSNIPCPFLVTTQIFMPDYERTRSKANLMAARSKQIAASEVAHYLPSLKVRAQDYETVTEEYAKNGALCHLAHQVFLFAPEGEEVACVNAALSTFKEAHLDLAEDACMHLQSFLASLPLTLTPSFQEDLKVAQRTGTKTLTNACHMVPIVAEFRGMGARDNDEAPTPLLLTTGRHGQIAPIDLFANGGNFNAVVVGSSGSGKSALTNDLITGNLGTAGKTYVIDVGGSYKKLCRLLGGQWIEYASHTDDPPLVINPFDLIRNINNDMGFLIPILVEMASPNEGLSDFLLSALQAHVLKILDSSQRDGRVATITDLVERLRTGTPDPRLSQEGPEAAALADARILDLATQLSPYARGGVYGHYFEGKSTVNFTARFIVLELEGLKSRKNLQSVVLLCLIFLINQDLTQGDVACRKMVVIDEAWDLLSHKHAAGFIETGYRRARKQNASFITITQSFADYYKNETTQAAFANADIQFILRQKPEGIAFLEKEKKLVLSPWEVQAIKSLRLQENEYAECLFKTPTTVPAVLQIRFDDFSRLLYSTRATDVAAIDYEMAQGATLSQAIARVIDKRKAHRAHSLLSY